MLKATQFPVAAAIGPQLHVPRIWTLGPPFVLWQRVRPMTVHPENERTEVYGRGNGRWRRVHCADCHRWNDFKPATGDLSATTLSATTHSAVSTTPPSHARRSEDSEGEYGKPFCGRGHTMQSCKQVREYWEAVLITIDRDIVLLTAVGSSHGLVDRRRRATTVWLRPLFFLGGFGANPLRTEKASSVRPHPMGVNGRAPEAAPYRSLASHIRKGAGDDPGRASLFGWPARARC